MTNVSKRNDESLIERAAKVYDFGAHLRRHDAPSSSSVQPPATTIVDPVVPATVGAAEPAVADQTDQTLDLIKAAPPAPEGAETLSPEAAATLAAIPPELRAGAEPQTEGEILPPGFARIDRVMLAEKGMLVPGAPIGALAEEFRLVKRQLLLNMRTIGNGPLGQRSRTILVGSGKPGDGKTFCAINLAISLAAERDLEVLLVDGDFAKPDVMVSLGIGDSTGFLDILGDPSINPEDCVIQTDVPQLSLLPAGGASHADTELLASARTGKVIDRLLAANPRRIIVFDSPPALAASPASVLALLVGQVMLVVRADRTTESDVRQAVNRLDGCEHISLVLNAVSYEAGSDRFGSYYGQER